MNLLKNAGFLDGSDGWAVSGGLAMLVDEAVRGAPGRHVLTASGTTSGSDQTVTLGSASDGRAAVTAGQVLEVSAGVLAVVAGAAVSPAVSVVWRNSGGSVISTAALAVSGPHSAIHGEGRYGVRTTFRRVYGRLTVPAGAVSAALVLAVTPATASAVVLALLKPMIAVVVAARSEPLVWDPGSHDNGDLALPCWPSGLRSFDVGPGSQPSPDRVDFQAGSARPSQRRTATDPVRSFNGSLRCDPVEKAMLDAFWRTGPGPFWFVAPDSDRLCVATPMADGAPKVAEDRGEVSTISVGLWLETA